MSSLSHNVNTTQIKVKSSSMFGSKAISTVCAINKVQAAKLSQRSPLGTWHSPFALTPSLPPYTCAYSVYTCRVLPSAELERQKYVRQRSKVKEGQCQVWWLFTGKPSGGSHGIAWRSAERSWLEIWGQMKVKAGWNECDTYKDKVIPWG